MGFLGRKASSDEDTETAINLYRLAHDNPAVAAATILAHSEFIVPAVAHMLLVLGQNKALDESDFALLGIDEQELGRIVNAANESSSHEEFDTHLRVLWAVDAYNKQLDEIAAEKGVSLSEEDMKSFRKELAGFAHENEVSDLRIAYRLMCAEVGDPLKPFMGGRVPQVPGGYI